MKGCLVDLDLILNSSLAALLGGQHNVVIGNINFAHKSENLKTKYLILMKKITFWKWKLIS